MYFHDDFEKKQTLIARSTLLADTQILEGEEAIEAFSILRRLPKEGIIIIAREDGWEDIYIDAESVKDFI